MLKLDLTAIPFKIAANIGWRFKSDKLHFPQHCCSSASLSLAQVKMFLPSRVSAVYYNFFRSLSVSLVKIAILICAHFTSGVTLLIIK
jgi:hypothetical protein